MTFRGFDITPARPDEWSAAFTLALQHVPDDERPTRVANALALLAEREIDRAGIFVARTEAGVAGVQVCIPLHGASGLFWLPQVDRACADQDLANRLVETALTWLRQGGAKLAQALLAPSDLALAAPLIACGFRHITQLDYLRHDLQEIPLAPPASALQTEPYTPAIAGTFAETLERTYEGTLDCPELNGVRTMDEVLDGHRAQGDSRHPETWQLIRVDDVPAGVVLLSELPDRDGWDLSYIGVVPEHRRRGLGRKLALQTLKAVHDAHGLSLHVAVDRRNVPARRLYEQLGFQAAGTRAVFLQVLARSD